MRPTITSVFTINNTVQKSVTSSFSPTSFNLYYNNKNFLSSFSPLNTYGFNYYKRLYYQMLSKDKTTINSYNKSSNESLEFKPSKSNIKIIFHEQNDKEDEVKENENLQNDLLGNKRKRSKDNIISENDFNKNTKLSNENETIKKNMGRKKKEAKFKGNHTKFTDDNVIRKIKCHFLNYINNSLNDSLINKKHIFLKLDNFVNENLKKDYNIKLMDQTIKEIYANSKISNKYKKQNADINKCLIDKIYLENNEIETIKILDQTYIELFNKLKKDKLDKFCEEIIKKEVKNGLSVENKNKYLTRIKYLCENYKEWFVKKVGRRGKNNKTENVSVV